MALVDAAPRSATATAEEEDIQLVEVDYPQFFYPITRQPAFALKLLQTLARRIRYPVRHLAEGV